jgi:hypothetical protein
MCFLTLNFNGLRSEFPKGLYIISTPVEVTKW